MVRRDGVASGDPGRTVPALACADRDGDAGVGVPPASGRRVRAAPDPRDDPAFLLGWAQGVADAGARLTGVVAGALGPDDPLVDRMVVALGRLVGDDRYREEP